MQIDIPINVKIKTRGRFAKEQLIGDGEVAKISLSAKITPSYLLLFYASIRFFFLGIKELIAKA